MQDGIESLDCRYKEPWMYMEGHCGRERERERDEENEQEQRKFSYRMYSYVRLRMHAYTYTHTRTHMLVCIHHYNDIQITNAYDALHVYRFSN